jgi:hypothetical protein
VQKLAEGRILEFNGLPLHLFDSPPGSIFILELPDLSGPTASSEAVYGRIIGKPAGLT